MQVNTSRPKATILQIAYMQITIKRQSKRKKQQCYCTECQTQVLQCLHKYGMVKGRVRLWLCKKTVSLWEDANLFHPLSMWPLPAQCCRFVQCQCPSWGQRAKDTNHCMVPKASPAIQPQETMRPLPQATITHPNTIHHSLILTGMRWTEIVSKKIGLLNSVV